MTPNQTLKHYPLSSPQLDFWFDQILHPDVPLYNIGGYVRIEGPIEPALFERALNQVIAENDALRIMLHEGESLPTQTFAENVHLNLDFQDFSETENAHEATLKWMKQEFVKPFQLYDGLLFQYTLCKASANCYYWLKKYHHLIADGWGISLIVQRVAAAYNALATGKTSEPTNFAYSDFIQNDQAYLDSKAYGKAKRYWQEKYNEVPKPLLKRRYASQFPGQTIPSQRATLCLKRPFYNQLDEFALQNKVSTFHVVLGALYCYFVRTCHRDDFAVGLPMLNRNNAAFKQTAGVFTGISPAWFRFGTDLSFVELMEKIRKELQKDYRHQRFPIGEINRQTGLHQNQIFELTLSYAKHDFDTNFNGNPARTFHLTNGFVQNALDIFIEEFHQQDDVNIYFDYNFGFFDADEMERLKARFEFLLGEILRKPSVPVRELQIMPDAELNQIWVEWNNTATDYPREKTIVELFEKQVGKTPTAIAVVFGNQSVTYQELNLKANRLAHHLQTLFVKPDELVGLCVEASLEMIVGLLSILKAGGAYVPLDPNYPPERLAFMLSNAQAKVLLTQQKWLEQLPQLEQPIFCLDSDWAKISKPDSANLTRIAQPDHLIYVIYTSGSTGKPKGAGIYHRGFTNLVNWFVTDFTLTAADSVLVISSFSFDLTQKNFFAPLIVGGQLHLLPQGHYDPKSILQTVHEQKITWLNCTPSAFYPLMESSENRTFQKLTSLRYVFLGGEPISLTKLLPWLQSTACQAKVVNTYGPTECSDVCALYLLPKPPPFLEPAIPIGKPISNAKLFILGKHLEVLPIGVAGELHIGGVGLGCGYLNSPDLTAEKFINNPFDDDPHSRLYKTGDLARYLPDGNIEFLGRIDNQVKIRGFRIELSEIEAVLLQHQAIQEAVVTLSKTPSNDKRLIAYVVSSLDNLELLDDSVPEYKTEIVSQWADVFDENYVKSATEPDLSFNLAGWNSSYTGLPLKGKEMQIWVDSTVNTILSLHPNQVLEIGCGTGLLLSRIAPFCRQYWGTDVSPVVSQKIEQLKHNVDNLKHVVCLNCQADDFMDIEAETFDTIILNSVVQYFPDVTYFMDVLDKAFKVIKPGGHLFIGDLRNLSLHRAYHASVQFYQASDSLSRFELQRLVQEGIFQEQELLIDPTFFTALTQKYPKLTKVQIRLKRGDHHNELTQFRYDVILQMGGTVSKTVEVAWQDWQTHPFTLSTLRQHLVENQPDMVGLRQVPNARLETSMKILEWLTNAAPTNTVGQLRKDLAEEQPVGIDPEKLWKLGEELSYNVSISWAGASPDGCYDVLFKHRTELDEEPSTITQFPFPIPQSKPWHHYANNPLQGKLNQKLVAQLRQFLQDQLPDYMVPSAFVRLENLPLTPNGKIDRRALSQLSVSHSQLSEKTFIAPRTADEKLLADIWASVLGVERIGIRDNFFELGGHSLLAVNLMTRIEQQFGKKLPLSALVEGATIEQLATVVNQSTDKMWSSLVAIQPNGTKRPFFCVPGIGGNVTDFYELALKLGKDQPFYGLQAVGLDGKSKPYTNLEDMATHYIKEMQTVLQEGPYLLGGHSFGGLVAFEMSQQLQKQGHEVALLAIIDMIAPNLFNQLKKLGWNEAKCLSNLAHLIESRLGKPVKVSDEMLQLIESKGQLNELLEQFKKASLLPPDADVTHIRGLIDVYKANCRMDYIPKNIKPTRIVFFQASEFIGELMGGYDELVEAEPAWGWSQYADGSVDILMVPGSHFTMMNQPHVLELADKLKVCLEQALAI